MKMSILSKINTMFWFILRPKYWSHLIQLLKRKIINFHDESKERKLGG